MRNNAKRLVSVLLAVALVFTLSVTAFAAEDESPLFTLKCTDSAIKGDLVSVSVDVTQASVVSDGVLAFTYDSAKLAFHSAQAGAAWADENDLSLQVNSTTLDELIIAFAGLDAADAGTLFVLNFVTLDEGQSVVALDQENSYINTSDSVLIGNITIEVVCYAADFTDVNLNEYYHESIDFVVARGLMNGVGHNLFAPKASANRAMLVTILYRMAGSPDVSGTMPFADVSADTYYYDAVLWAAQEGVTTGMSKTIFAPTMNVTREQMVTFFGRYAENCGISVNTDAGLDGFLDAAQVSDFALPYMAWSVEMGIIKGMGEGMLQPKGTSTRDQLATVIMRYVQTVTE